MIPLIYRIELLRVKKRNVDASKDGENGQKIVATQSPAVQAEYIKSLQHKVYKDASDLELVELCFSGRTSHPKLTHR